MKKFTIGRKEIWLTLAFLTFYVPASYAVPAIIFSLWEYSYMAVALISLLILLIKCSEKINFRYLIFVIFYGWLYVGTKFFSRSSIIPFGMLIKCVGFISVLEVGFSLLSKKQVAKSYLLSGILVSVIHFISYILYSDLEGGMRHGQTYIVAGNIMRNSDQNWFWLTYDNASIFYFLPIAAAILYYYKNYSKKAIKIFVLYAGFILYMYLAKIAATAIVAMLIFTVFAVYYLYHLKHSSLKKMKVKLNYSLSIITGVIFSILMLSIVGGGLATKIGNYFGKDGSFSGRDMIWKKSIKYILDRPLFGYGIENSELKWDKLGQSHCHNIFLEIIYTGGLVALILFVLILILFKPKKENSFSNYIFSAALLSFFIVSGVDWLYSNPFPMAIFYFIYYFQDYDWKIIRGIL